MHHPTPKRVTWKMLLDVALCEQLSEETRAFATAALLRLAEYLDDANFFECTQLNVTPFAVGKPIAPDSWGPEWLRGAAG